VVSESGVWQGNLVGTNTRGHEYVRKHLLGTHDNVLGNERADGTIDEVDISGDTPGKKLDLMGSWGCSR